MPIPTSKPLSLSTVQTEYGGTNPISLSEYYSKGNAPASGAITLWQDFNGTSNLSTQDGILYWTAGSEYYAGTDGSAPHNYNQYVSGWEGSDSTDVAALATPSVLDHFTSGAPFTRLFKMRQSGSAFAGASISNITKCKLYVKVDSQTEESPVLAGSQTADSRYAIGIGATSTFSSYLANFAGLDLTQGEASSVSNGAVATIEYDLLANLGASSTATWLTNQMPLYVGLEGESFDWSYGGGPPQGDEGTTECGSGQPFAFWVDATFDYS